MGDMGDMGTWGHRATRAAAPRAGVEALQTLRRRMQGAARCACRAFGYGIVRRLGYGDYQHI
jgi:hypothetical protein